MPVITVAQDDRLEVKVMVYKVPNNEVLVDGRFCEITDTKIDPRVYLDKALDAVGFRDTSVVELVITGEVLYHPVRVETKATVTRIITGLDDPMRRLQYYCSNPQEFATIEECYSFIRHIIEEPLQ